MEERFHYQSDTVQLCATLAGCRPNNGMVCTFNLLNDEGAFDDCRTIGDFYTVWLARLASSNQAQVERIASQAKPAAPAPRGPDRPNPNQPEPVRPTPRQPLPPQGVRVPEITF